VTLATNGPGMENAKQTEERKVHVVEEWLMSHWEELMGRPSGPLFVCLVLQPMVAAVLAIRAGRTDAREGRPAFLWGFVRQPENRRILLLDACRGIGKLFLVGVELDIVYQLIVLHGLRPVQSLIVATVLAVIPYLVVRGLTNRALTLWRGMGRHRE
jgi:hypothetical protein